jgi:hypothetical protein
MANMLPVSRTSVAGLSVKSVSALAIGYTDRIS